MSKEQGKREKQAREHCTSTYLQKPEHCTHSPYTIIYTHTLTGTLYLLFMVTCTYCTVYSHIHAHMHIDTLPPVHTHACTHTLMHTLYTHRTHRHMSTLYLQCILTHTHCIKYSHMLIVVLTFLSTYYTRYTCFSL